MSERPPWTPARRAWVAIQWAGVAVLAAMNLLAMTRGISPGRLEHSMMLWACGSLSVLLIMATQVMLPRVPGGMWLTTLGVLLTATLAWGVNLLAWVVFMI